MANGVNNGEKSIYTVKLPGNGEKPVYKMLNEDAYNSLRNNGDVELIATSVVNEEK